MHLVELYASSFVGLVQDEKNVVWFARTEVLRWFNFFDSSLIVFVVSSYRDKNFCLHVELV